jgi:hypothetical protein
MIPDNMPKSDYPSIRFLENETSGLLSYWIERDADSYVNVAWVRRLENSDNTIWMYYGNPSASSAENGNNVFLTFYDFGDFTNPGWGETMWTGTSNQPGYGIDWRADYVLLFDYNNWRAKLERKPPVAELSMERTIEFRVRAQQVDRGGLILSGPGTFGDTAGEYACIHNISGARFYSYNEQSPTGLVQADNWYIGRVDMYNNNRIRVRFYSGEPNNYRSSLWTAAEKGDKNWNPNTDSTNYCDKYNLSVWDSGGNSSYFYDWFFVRKYAATAPTITFGSEENYVGQPVVPVLFSPANGTYTSANTPTFTWLIGNAADNHRLLVDNDLNFASPEEDVLLGATDNTYTVTSPLLDGTYYWEVIAINSYGQTSSLTWTIQIDARPQPTAFDLVWPEDGAAISDNTPTLIWENSYDNWPGLNHYEVWFDNSNVENVLAGITSYDTTQLSWGSTHQWYVVAVGNVGNRRICNRTFTFETAKVDIVSHDENSFLIQTGEYVLHYSRGISYVEIYRVDLGKDNGLLRLVVGGGDPKLRILYSENIDNILVTDDQDNVIAKMQGHLYWANFEISVVLPRSMPRLINYSLKLNLTKNIPPENNFFSSTYPELSYRFDNGSSVDPNLIDYFYGLPTAWSDGLRDEYSRDLNEFVFFGDQRVLKSTLLYYTDFNSLNRFFEASNTFFTVVSDYTTHTNDVVKQPPGLLGSTKTPPITFGYDLPPANATLMAGSTLVVSNSFISLDPGYPSIYSTIDYSKRFLESLSSMYPLIEKPPTEYLDWPSIVENSIRDLENQDALLRQQGRSGGLHPYAVDPYKEYAARFGTENSLIFVENAQSKISYNSNYHYRYGTSGIFGGGGTVEPVHFLFPYCEWATYADEFNSENVKSMFVSTENVITDLGRGLDYIFTFHSDVTNSAPVNDGQYQYEGVGEYIYIMLYYYKFTDNDEYLIEAERAADALMHMGFEYSYEYFATPIATEALVKLYEITGNENYLEGSYIPLAGIMRNSWLFNPDFVSGIHDYENRTIFLLTSARPNLSYANGWEEQALMEYLYRYLSEGHDVLMPDAVQLTSELLRYKGTSSKDALAPLQPDNSNIFVGVPREWSLPVHNEWFIPLEGFGILKYDEKLGAISQPPYCSGMLPEAALLQFHPLWENTFLYVDTPIDIENKGDSFVFEVLAIDGRYKVGLGGKIVPDIIVKPLGETSAIEPEYDPTSGLFQLEVSAGRNYTIERTVELISPEDGVTILDNVPTFEWNVGLNVDNHRLLVDNDADFSSPAENVLLGASDNSYTPSMSLGPDNYSWKVIAINTYGQTESSVWTFVVTSLFPGKPVLYSPSDGVTTMDNTPTFEWTIGENANNHRLLVDNDPDFSSPVENVLLGASDNSYAPATPLSPENYSWKVIAINTYGEAESSVWTFVIKEVQPLWAGTVTITRDNLYSVTINLDGDFGTGSNLVAKFYTYGGDYQDNTFVDNENIPGHVTLNKHVSLPGNGAIQRLDLVVTDSGGTALGTIKTWATSRTVTIASVGQINGLWPFLSDAQKTTYSTELGSINGLWPFSPETYP